MGVNFAVLVGNCGADPEMHMTREGKEIARLRIATGERWKDRETGEKRERTEWHTVIVFSEGLAKVVKQYVKKGSRIFVRGAIRTRDWEGQDGVKRWTTEIHLAGFDAQLELLDSAGGAGRPGVPDSPGEGAGPGYDDGGGADTGGQRDLDDEIPF